MRHVRHARTEAQRWCLAVTDEGRPVVPRAEAGHRAVAAAGRSRGDGMIRAPAVRAQIAFLKPRLQKIGADGVIYATDVPEYPLNKPGTPVADRL